MSVEGLEGVVLHLDVLLAESGHEQVLVQQPKMVGELLGQQQQFDQLLVVRDQVDRIEGRKESKNLTFLETHFSILVSFKRT